GTAEQREYGENDDEVARSHGDTPCWHTTVISSAAGREPRSSSPAPDIPPSQQGRSRRLTRTLVRAMVTSCPSSLPQGHRRPASSIRSPDKGPSMRRTPGIVVLTTILLGTPVFAQDNSTVITNALK